MLSSLKKMRGDKKGWYKVSDLRPGVEIAVPAPDIDGSIESSGILWDEVVSIKPVGREHVYDIEVEGTRNFIGNGIFAHNTYVLRVNTMLAVDGEIYAENFIVPARNAAGAVSTSLPVSQIPPSVLTADGLGVDLYKLATYNLAVGQALAEKVDAHEMRLVSLDERVAKLESGAVSVADDSPLALSSSTLARALEGLDVLIQKGIAQFKTLVFRRLVASSDADGASSAGSVGIAAGNVVAQVANSLVLPTTKIFVTFNSQLTGSWWVSDKAVGSFRVVLSEVQTADVAFDYFLVQTELQAPDPGIQTTDGSAGGATTTTASTTDSGLPTGQAGTTASTTTSGGDATPPAVSDVEPPVVTLAGDAALQITVGDAFTDPGATALDPSTDSTGSGQVTDLTSSIVVTGAVDTTTTGLYELTYTATDAAGNTGSASRVVTVVAPSPAPADTSSADSGADTSNVTP